jgi:hypothetical protein
MATRARVADPRAAPTGPNAPSVSDVFSRVPKKPSRTSADVTKEGPAMLPDISAIAAAYANVQVVSSSKDAMCKSPLGKSRFFRESRCLARAFLFGHGTLSLESRPKDYGEMRVYSGVSSLDEMSPAREEYYPIARSLGLIQTPGW